MDINIINCNKKIAKSILVLNSLKIKSNKPKKIAIIGENEEFLESKKSLKQLILMQNLCQINTLKDSQSPNQIGHINQLEEIIKYIKLMKLFLLLKT